MNKLFRKYIQSNDNFYFPWRSRYPWFWRLMWRVYWRYLQKFDRYGYLHGLWEHMKYTFTIYSYRLRRLTT